MRRILAELRSKDAMKTWFERARMWFWIFTGNTLRRERASGKRTASRVAPLVPPVVGLRREMGGEGRCIVWATREPMGTMLAGQTVEAMWASLRHAKPLALGMNCATGPEFMTDHIRTLSQLTGEFVSCYPNAGLPDEEGKYLETPTTLAAQLEKFADHGWLNLVGGCCGTTVQHIRAIAQMAEGKRPRAKPAEAHRALYSGIEAIEAEDSTRPLLVGERTNVIGSRLFKNLVAEAKWEEASEIARRQVRVGAQVVDVCLQCT